MDGAKDHERWLNEKMLTDLSIAALRRGNGRRKGAMKKQEGNENEEMMLKNVHRTMQFGVNS